MRGSPACGEYRPVPGKARSLTSGTRKQTRRDAPGRGRRRGRLPCAGKPCGPRHLRTTIVDAAAGHRPGHRREGVVVQPARPLLADVNCRERGPSEHDDARRDLSRAGSAVGDHRARARRPTRQRGPDQVQGGRPVPLRRPHPEGRRADALPGGRRTRGRRDRRRGRRGRHPGQGRRPRRLLVHPGLRQMPVLLDRPPEPVRRGQERLDRRVPRRHVPLPPERRGPRRAVRARHVLRVRGRQSSSPSSPSRTTSRSRSPRWWAAASRPDGGAAVYAAGVRAGQTVVVYGAGGVGSNAVQGARYAGAQHVVVVDPVAFKREMAKVFGATHTFATAAEAARVRHRDHLGRARRPRDHHGRCAARRGHRRRAEGRRQDRPGDHHRGRATAG